MKKEDTLFMTKGITDSYRILHTPGDFARKNLLYVQEVGKLKSLQPHKSQRENLDSFLILIVLAGEGQITVDKESYLIKEGDCAFINCKDYYAHESSKKKPWELMWVHFNGGIAEAYFKLFMEKNNYDNIIRPDYVKNLETIIEKLIKYQNQKDMQSELLSGVSLLQLVNECIFAALLHEKGGQESSIRICDEIREKVNTCYQEENLISALSEKYQMSEIDLDNNFLKAYGISLRDYILNRRFTAAKELLRFTIKPIKDIIAESGIKNDDLFRRLFQDSEGMTAEEYRMKWSQWVK